jgi:hypothetical protein
MTQIIQETEREGGGGGCASSKICSDRFARTSQKSFLFVVYVGGGGGVPLARVPLELISASSSRPLPLGSPTDLRPSMIPGPDTRWALVM